MSSLQRKLHTKAIVSILKYFGIHEYDIHILQHLQEFNYKCILLIMKEAKSCARLAKKTKIDINDVKVAILKAKDGKIPRISPPDNVRQNVNIIEESDIKLINIEFYNKIIAQIQKTNYILPEITDSDIEEVISSGKEDNQDKITEKFNVNSLLNDPYSL